MKISKYTKLIKYQRKYFIYNSISNFLCKIDRNLFQILHEKQNNNEEFEFNEINDNDTWNLLERNKIITNSEKDDLLLIATSFHQMRRDSNILNLTLAPTMDCNFYCPYCFETKRKGEMSSDIINNVINFVKNYENIKHINLVWFGGEPLLYPNVIEQISTKICNSEKYTYSAKIITNGYYMTVENLKMLSDCKINFVQLSMDGVFEGQNKKKFTKTDKDTFSTIINNIDNFSKSEIKIKLGIRINVDNENIREYTNIIDFFNEKYGHDERIFVVPAFIHNTTKKDNKGTISDFEQKLEFWKKVAKITKNTSRLYPENNIYECAIRNYHSWVIDEMGNIYKCWEIIGNEGYKVGELTEKGIKITNITLLNRYLYGADHLADRKCQDCFSFPLCGGCCPHKRIENEFNNKNFDICYYKDDNLEKYIIEHIKLKYS